MMRNVIQISPTYPPHIGGVVQYAELQGKHFLVKKIKSKFFISDRFSRADN